MKGIICMCLYNQKLFIFVPPTQITSDLILPLHHRVFFCSHSIPDKQSLLPSILKNWRCGVEPLAPLLFIQQSVSHPHISLARSPSFCWLPWALFTTFTQSKVKTFKGGILLLPWSFPVYVWDELLASSLIFEGIYNFAGISFVHIFRLYWKKSLVMKGHVDFPDQ